MAFNCVGVDLAEIVNQIIANLRNYVGIIFFIIVVCKSMFLARFFCIGF